MRPHARANGPLAAMAFLLVLCAILLPQPAVALRASPAQVIIPQGSDGMFAIRVLDATDPAQVTVMISGDLAGGITLDAPVAHPQDGVVIAGRLTIPDDAAPGDHVQEIIIGLAPTGMAGTITARAELAIPIIARIPYPDAYLVADWNAQPDPGSGDTRVTISLENRGRVSVTTAPITISFADGERELPPLELAASTIAPGAFVGLSGGYAVPDDAQPGEYAATLRVPYAGTVLAQTKGIALGVPRIAIDSVAYDVAETGAIVPVDIDGRIVWNRPLALDVAVFLDEQPTPAAIERALDVAPGAFSRRLYVDTARTGRANVTVRATVTAGGVTAERTDPIAKRASAHGRAALAPLVWMSVALVLILLLIYLLLRWWRKRTPPLMGVPPPEPLR